MESVVSDLDLQEILRRARASDDVSRGMSLCRAWVTCKRGDGLLRLAAILGVDLKIIVMAACACARLASVYVPKGEDRPRQVIETGEAWCRGEVSLERVRSAAVAAFYAFEDCVEDDDTAYAALAAYAAVRAAYDTPIAAANAVCCAARAARARDGANAGVHMLKQCADLVRQAIPYHAIAAGARRVLKNEMESIERMLKSDGVTC